MLYKKEFKGGVVGAKAARHYYRSVMGGDINTCIVTIPPEMRCQLGYFLTKKLMSKELLQRRMIIQNDRYQKDVDISANNLCMRSSGSRGDAASIGYNAIY